VSISISFSGARGGDSWIRDGGDNGGAEACTVTAEVTDSVESLRPVSSEGLKCTALLSIPSAAALALADGSMSSSVGDFRDGESLFGGVTVILPDDALPLREC